MTVTTAKARPFTKEDWYGLAGAESWGKEQPPVLREVNGWLFVADRNGVECFGDNAVCGSDSLRLSVALPNQSVAKALLNGLPEDIDPVAFGFEAV